jgi:hypothetical protein
LKSAELAALELGKILLNTAAAAAAAGLIFVQPRTSFLWSQLIWRRWSLARSC